MTSIAPIKMSEQLRMMRGAGEILRPDRSGPKTDDVNAGAETGKVSFGEFLSNQLSKVNSYGVEADRAMEAATAGEEVNPHSTLIAMQKASISLNLMMGIKQRLEQAYQELIRTPMG